MHIAEPVTTLTDYALAAASLFYGHRLYHHESAQRNVSVRLWAFAFVATAGASIFGGTYHGFATQLNDSILSVLWKVTVYSLGLMSLLMLSGTIVASVSRSARIWLLAAAAMQFIAYAAWMITHEEFRYVIYDYAPAMVGVVALQVWALYRRRDASVASIIIGVVSCGVLVAGAWMIAGERRRARRNALLAAASE